MSVKIIIETPAGIRSIVEVDAMDTIENVMSQIALFSGMSIQHQQFMVCFAANNIDQADNWFQEIIEENEQEAGPASPVVQNTNDEFEEDETEADRTWTYEHKKAALDFYNEKPGRTFTTLTKL